VAGVVSSVATTALSGCSTPAGEDLKRPLAAMCAATTAAVSAVKRLRSCPSSGPEHKRRWTCVDPETDAGTGYAVQTNGEGEVINVVSYTGKMTGDAPDPNLSAFCWAINLVTWPLSHFEFVRSAEVKETLAWLENVAGGKGSVQRMSTDVLAKLNRMMFSSSSLAPLLGNLRATVEGSVVQKLFGSLLKRVSCDQFFEAARAMLEASAISSQAALCRGLKGVADGGAHIVAERVKGALAQAAVSPPWWQFWKSKPSWIVKRAAQSAPALAQVALGIFETATSAICKRWTKRDRMQKFALALGLTPGNTCAEFHEQTVGKRYRHVAEYLHPDKKTGEMGQSYFKDVTEARDSLLDEIRNFKKSELRMAADFVKDAVWKGALNCLGALGTAFGFIESNSQAIVPKVKSWFSWLWG